MTIRVNNDDINIIQESIIAVLNSNCRLWCTGVVSQAAKSRFFDNLNLMGQKLGALLEFEVETELWDCYP